MDTAEIGQRIRRTLAEAKTSSAERRKRTAVAEAESRQALGRIAVPVMRTIASVLTAESYRCSISTPNGAVRLSFDSPRDAYIEVVIDTANDPPALIGRTGRTRGSRVLSDEQVIVGHPAIGQLTAEDLVSFVQRELLLVIDR
jgi:hypothetical protein|tara:strand:- start:1138 stop:1566 length:429 start_codon:yes stop_codon:yes gene_type:complete